jgi:hypothetical protein
MSEACDLLVVEVQTRRGRTLYLWVQVWMLLAPILDANHRDNCVARVELVRPWWHHEPCRCRKSVRLLPQLTCNFSESPSPSGSFFSLYSGYFDRPGARTIPPERCQTPQSSSQMAGDAPMVGARSARKGMFAEAIGAISAYCGCPGGWRIDL